MSPEQKERYVRWQNYRINQLTFSINLFLTFAVASLAYAINIKISDTAGIELSALFPPIYWWSASVALGCISTVSRLLDFRYTAKKIKNSNGGDECKAKMFGWVTWGTFWGLILSYVIGGHLFVSNIVFA